MLFAEIVTSYGFRPVFFWPNYAKLTAEEMRWLASLGEACGHTVSHQRLREMGWSAQLDEIAPNKAWIEGILGEPITCFAYPFGAYDQNRLARAVPAHGIAALEPEADRVQHAMT